MRKIRVSHQRGVGIVEIMIALTLSLVLTAGVFQFYSASKQSYRLADALSRVQETGRFAIDAIARDVRMADFWGCGARSSIALVNNLDSAATTYLPFRQAVAGVNGASDTLTLGFARSVGVNVVTHSLTSGTVNVSPAVRESLANVGDYVVLCNSVAADVFRVTAVSGGNSVAKTRDTFTIPSGTGGNVAAGACQQSPGVDAACFATRYNAEAEFTVATRSTYRIQDGSVSNQPGLFVSINGANAQEVIEGVENMQIVYGEDTNGDRQADRYVAADVVGSMDSVVSLRVSLLVRSSEPNVTSEAQPVTFNGATISGADRRLRQVYTATLTLRNRVL